MWSTYRRELIVMKLDLEELEDCPTNQIDGFYDRIQALMPTLFTHRCSEKKPGGFFERVRMGTWMGHVIEHIAIELQCLAGMPVGFGRTRSTSRRGVYHVVFAYQTENAGLYAAKAAVRIAVALVSDTYYDIAQDIKELIKISKREGIGPSTQSMINEARRRGIPYKRLDTDSLVMFGQGVHQKIIRATLACTTSSVGVDLAADKQETKRILEEGFIPVPKGVLIKTREEMLNAIDSLDFPLAVKPLNGNHGRGITTNINSVEQAQSAFTKAKEISDEIIVEKFNEGVDYRFLVVNYQLVAVAKRTPAMVVGDNQSTIKELIEKTNNDPNRGEGHEKVLTTIKVDAATNTILVEKNLTLNSVLAVGEVLYLKDTANISTGGTARDVTDIIHPYNVFLAERIARLMNLDICGIDIIAKDINVPIKEGTGAVLEVNAGPGFRMHLSPAKGIARNVAEPVMRMLFPPGSPSRIPIVAVTGTNGKTTTTRLVAHFAKNAGHTVGFTTTDGIFIQDQAIYYGDCSGPASAEAILRDPIVDFAVLECARGGILRSGLGFDKCDISIITNISEDHLGLGDIETLEQLAKVKAVIAHSTFDEGHAILNADDDIVYAISEELDCNIALFSMSDKNQRVIDHCAKGGYAAFIEKGYLTVAKGEWKTRFGKIKDIPLTLEGRAECMIKNLLPSVLAAVIRNFDVKMIRKALMTFIPGPEQTPGRMNVFKFSNFDVMIDYAHNSDGLIQLEKFLQQVESPVKVGIITSPGDRRDEDIRNIGIHSGKMFDEIIIRHDTDLRGRTKENITQLITEGIRQVNPAIPITVISDECESLRFAMDNAKEGSFIVMCTDKVQEILEFVKQAKDSEANQGQLETVTVNSL